MKTIRCIVGTIALVLLVSSAAPGDLLDGLGKFDASGAGESILKVGKSAKRAMDVKDMTPSSRYYIGRGVAANILTQHRVYDDAEAKAYVNKVGAAVAAASDMPYVYNGYRFVILDSEEVNAFAVPGAYVLITRGMLRCCQTEDELAAVLAHEVAHIQRDHALAAIKKSRHADVLKVALTEGAGHAAGGSDLPMDQVVQVMADSVGDITKKVMVEGYGREAEGDADRDAVEILKRVGYDPNALTSMLKRMEAKAPKGSAGFGKTHPPASDRIKSISKLIKTKPVASPQARQQRFDAALAKAIAP